MESSCTAHISATINVVCGTVAVKYCCLHVGHLAELSHLRLSSAVRLEIATLLRPGVTVSEVLDSLHNRVGDTPSRDNLVSRLVVAAVLIVFVVVCVVFVPLCSKTVDSFELQNDRNYDY